MFDYVILFIFILLAAIQGWAAASLVNLLMAPFYKWVRSKTVERWQEPSARPVMRR